MFKEGFGRFATFGVVSVLPGELIDSVWHIIDRNLQGIVPLSNLLEFDINKKPDGKVAMTFSERNVDFKMTVDLPFDWDASFPDKVLAYDDGNSQTILLPTEAH